MGSSFGAHVGEAIIVLLITAVIVGMVGGVGLWITVQWLLHHLSVTIS